MQQNIQCTKCNSENTKLISEPIEIEKNCNGLFLVFFFFFTFISIIGLILIIKYLFDIMYTELNTRDYEYTISALIDYNKNLKKAQNGIYIGLIVFAIGLLPQIIMAIIHSLATKYSIKSELKIICLDCNHKIDYIKLKNQNEAQKEENQPTNLNGN